MLTQDRSRQWCNGGYTVKPDKQSAFRTLKNNGGSPIKEKKSYAHVESLMADVVKACHREGVDHEAEAVILSKNISGPIAPSKQDRFEAHWSLTDEDIHKVRVK